MANGSDDDVRFLTDISLGGSLCLEQVSELPQDAKVGTLLVLNDTLYAYLIVQGIEAWCPFAKIPMNFVYTQDIPSFEWRILHNLNTLTPWIQVKDVMGNPAPYGITLINSNDVILHFLSAISGSALIMSNDIPQI